MRKASAITGLISAMDQRRALDAQNILCTHLDIEEHQLHSCFRRRPAQTAGGGARKLFRCGEPSRRDLQPFDHPLQFYPDRKNSLFVIPVLHLRQFGRIEACSCDLQRFNSRSCSLLLPNQPLVSARLRADSRYFPLTETPKLGSTRLKNEW